MGKDIANSAPQIRKGRKMNCEFEGHVLDLEQNFEQTGPKSRWKRVTQRRVPGMSPRQFIPVDVSPAKDRNLQTDAAGQRNATFVFYAELRRRNVLRAAATYVVVAWIIAQVADVLCAGFAAPDWIMKATLISLGIGFPIVLIISWYVEITANGVVWDPSIEEVEGVACQKGRVLDFLIIAVLTAIIGMLLMR